MFAALVSLLGGSAFRLLAGEVVAFFKAKQESTSEIALLHAQAQIDAAKHAQTLEMLRLQADLGVKTVAVEMDRDVRVAEAQAFRDALAQAQKPTGIPWVDAWNASIRPAYASVALVLWLLALISAGFKLTEWDISLMGAIIGFYFADRTLRKAGR